MFDALEMSIAVMEQLAPIEAKVRQRRKSLADEIGRGAESVSLNLSEGRQRAGLDRVDLFRKAAGSASELTTALRIAKVRRFQQCIANASQTCAIEHSAVRSRLENINRAHDTLVDATSRALDAVRARRSKDRRTPSPSARSR